MVIFHSYGLAGAVISNDLERCERVSKVRFYCIYIMSSHPSLNNHEDSKYWRSCSSGNVNYISFFLLLCRPLMQGLYGSTAHSHASVKLHGEETSVVVLGVN